MSPTVENEKDINEVTEKQKVENNSALERKDLKTNHSSVKDLPNNEKTSKTKIALAVIIPSIIIVIVGVIIFVLILNSNKNNGNINNNQNSSEISVTYEETKSKETESSDIESINSESLTTTTSINSESSIVVESSANSTKSYSVTNDEEASKLYEEMDQNVGARLSFSSSTIQNDQGYYFLSFSETGLPVQSDTIDLSLYENQIVSGTGSVKYEQKEENNTFIYLNIDSIQSN